MYLTGCKEAITELLIQDLIKQESVRKHSETGIQVHLLQMTEFRLLDPRDPMEIIHLLQTPEADQVPDLKQQDPTGLQQDPATQFHPNQNHR